MYCIFFLLKSVLDIKTFFFMSPGLRTLKTQIVWCITSMAVRYLTTSLNNVWIECFASTLEASECEIKLDLTISSSRFFLKINVLTCIKDPLKGRVSSLIMQADIVGSVTEDLVLPLLLWGDTPKLKMLHEVGVGIRHTRTPSEDYKWECLSQITVLTDFKSTSFQVLRLQSTSVWANASFKQMSNHYNVHA